MGMRVRVVEPAGRRIGGYRRSRRYGKPLLIGGFRLEPVLAVPVVPATFVTISCPLCARSRDYDLAVPSVRIDIKQQPAFDPSWQSYAGVLEARIVAAGAAGRSRSANSDAALASASKLAARAIPMP